MISGKIKLINDTEEISEKFRKRTLVVTDDSGQYPQHIEVQFILDKCEQLDDFSIGEEVTIEYTIKGREWKNPKDGSVRYFNTIEGVSITAGSF